MSLTSNQSELLLNLLYRAPIAVMHGSSGVANDFFMVHVENFQHVLIEAAKEGSMRIIYLIH